MMEDPRWDGRTVGDVGTKQRAGAIKDLLRRQLGSKSERQSSSRAKRGLLWVKIASRHGFAYTHGHQGCHSLGQDGKVRVILLFWHPTSSPWPLPKDRQRRSDATLYRPTAASSSSQR